MPHIFLSYRREDTGYVAGILYERLQKVFGSSSVFIDVDTIPLGVDFREHLYNAVSKCDVLLAIIGDSWLGSINQTARAIDNPTDFVRIEIEAALQRKIPIVPVLVGKAQMPMEDALPETLRPLVFRNAAELRSGRDMNHHIESLIQGLQVHLTPSRISPQPGIDTHRQQGMNVDARKTALRMIPYGLYILTAEGKNGAVAAASINWVSQASFDPPLVMLGVKIDSRVHAMIKETKKFALNVLGKGQQGIAFNFFKSHEPHERKGNSIGGEPFEKSPGGVPILCNTPAWVECKLVDTVERGDHSLFIGEVTEAGVRKAPTGRADDVTLVLKDLGERVFYGG
jgi:flavin reductase (DIM6/NTAB) family NADH-FMN oxidoreductase RutF